MTLAELKLRTSDRSIMKHNAIDCAILRYGEEARCTCTTGRASHDKRSNAYAAAQSAGFGNYTIFSGPRAGRYATEGFWLLIVEL